MRTSKPGPSGVTIVTRRDIYYMAQQNHEKYFGRKLDLVQTDIINKEDFPSNQQTTFLKVFSRLKSVMKSKWDAANRTEENFLLVNQKWLEGTVEIPKRNKCGPGRPEKPFAESSECSKRRKTQKVRNSVETEELLYASQMILRESGNAAAAIVIKDVIMSPTRGEEYRKALKKSEVVTSRRQAPNQALAMFVEAQLTRKQYNIIRTSDPKMYPCYDVLLREKKKYYPDEESIKISEICGEVRLQDLLNHTSTRLMIYLEDIMQYFPNTETVEAELIYKWGCDGSQQSRYKQKFHDVSDSDANIFQSSLVPLRLICSRTKKVLWQNPRPSSPRFCRPMRIRFIAESKEVTNEEISYFEDQIATLQNTRIQNEAFEKWQIRNQEDKVTVNTRKQEIQNRFKEELGLIVDMPKPGFGSTNDGNTSRRFFDNPEVSSAITGVDLILVRRFATILELISSGYKLDAQKFDTYCNETAKLYIEKYNWHPMTPTVHKILMHGPAIIQHALLPIGMLSEEAAEARNKHFRDYRLRYSRKFSRDQCMYDVFHRLLLTSDPYLSSIRPKPKRNAKPFSADARNIFVSTKNCSSPSKTIAM